MQCRVCQGGKRLRIAGVVMCHCPKCSADGKPVVKAVYHPCPSCGPGLGRLLGDREPIGAPEAEPVRVRIAGAPDPFGDAEPEEMSLREVAVGILTIGAAVWLAFGMELLALLFAAWVVGRD